jgi:EAL domain-containing protein (putative c-di-GMP-specific phosphodiesterase class I)
MAFQPVVDLALNRIDSYEALVRGPNGEGAESILGKVDAQTLYAFDQACRVKAIEMAAELKLDRRLNINFLPNAVYEPAACIRQTLNASARTGFPLDHLTFEIIEQEELAEAGHLLRIITEYHRLGFKVALDDFGTGYSGLSRLAELKPDIVKLDRSLIKDCDQDRVRMAIIASMVALCREIDVKIVFEGVEKLEEVETLRAAGARFMQGYFFAKPAFQSIVRDDAILWPVRPRTVSHAAVYSAGENFSQTPC